MSSAKNAYNLLIKSATAPSTNITKTNVIPNAIRIPDKSADGEMLRNLRMAVTPSYGYGQNTYETGKPPKPNTSSSLAGDPRRLTTCQNIRAEILEKWSKRPKPDVQKEWLKNLMFN
uniref:Uncharacterized protein n=1 Tax=Heliothis virescens TaxID=7102 RepID=A0A2A4J0K2_HELVI